MQDVCINRVCLFSVFINRVCLYSVLIRSNY